ncbi:MAG: Sec-independent protein translocase subunit TatA [Nocardioides sp.]|nr:Sec-independent protein translocase subunit TatA [Nocardioides sp.]
MPLPQIAGLGPGEIAIIIGVLVLLFGAKKLPELARGSGRALRIFKAETKGLMTDEEDDERTPEQRELDARAAAPSTEPRAQASTEPSTDATRETDR